MTIDLTEELRRQQQAEINSLQADRKQLMEMYGPVWDTQELMRDYDVIAFLAPYVQVVRRGDGQKGTLLFQHSPRLYHSFAPYGS